jgi:hypothetical protein
MARMMTKTVAIQRDVVTADNFMVVSKLTPRCEG